VGAKCLIKYQKKFSEEITQNWKEGSELPRLGRFYRYGFSVEIIKIISTSEHGPEKPLRTHWSDQVQSPV
jgi:hypothetical protein